MMDATNRSLIVALHDRYEALWKAHGDIDDARPVMPANQDSNEERQQHVDYCRAKEATDSLEAESDLIRQLIMLQPPRDDQDLTVLVYHAAAMSELTGLPDTEQRALSLGLDHILDYLVSEGRAPVELGECFRVTAIAAFNRLRLRTATPEQLDEIRPG